ncbi:hypothetical protein TWF694_009453 [Orbilia ellipsospora]|uniref:Peptidase S8/S53 domain-containing protein n=1 Tax=Orbilia ellipsospora TaxID=2528407 RepID=A0AAV9XDX1_9PEZI
MGLNGSQDLTPTRSQHGFGVDYGTNIHTFGENIRVAKINNLTKSESDRIGVLPSIAAVQKAIRITTPTPPRRVGITERLNRNQKFPRVSQKEVMTNITSIGYQSKRFNLLRKRDLMINITKSSWNLERISSVNTVNDPTRSVADLTYTYRYMENEPGHLPGTGVDAYLLDTGLATNISNIRGRAKRLLANLTDPDDHIGHGTMCAGVLGGTHYGVSGGANLYGIKVVGTNSSDCVDIAAALDQIITLHKQRLSDPTFKGSVVSMSIAYIEPTPEGFITMPEVKYPVMFELMKEASTAGIHLVAAGGNDSQDACIQGPAGFSRSIPLIGVGATNVDDSRADYSNYGPCINLYAPGTDITYQNTAGKLATVSGTSCAAPLVAGIVAYELGRSSQFKLDPAGMRKYLVSKALKGVLTPDPNMLLIYNGVDTIKKSSADIS